MKIKSSLLKKAISVAKSALPVRAAEPKFDAIWFDCSGKCLSVSGINSDGTRHEATVDCEEESTWSFSLASALVANAVCSMPQHEEIEFFVEKNKCVLKNSLGEMKIPVLNVDQVDFKNRTPELFFECPRQSLTKALQACKFAELSVKGVGTENTSLSSRGGSVFMFCRSSSAGALAEICQSDVDKKVYIDMQRFRRSLAACDGEAVSFFADETSCRIECDAEGMSISAEFMQAPSHKISIDSMARLDLVAEAAVEDASLARSAVAQASVLKLPEHCSVKMGFQDGGILVESETMNGMSSFLIPAKCESSRNVLAFVEAIERGLAIIGSSGDSVRLAVLAHQGEDKVVMLENETKTIRLFSATMERT